MIERSIIIRGHNMNLLLIILNLLALYIIYSLRNDRSKYLIYLGYILFSGSLILSVLGLIKELN